MKKTRRFLLGALTITLLAFGQSMVPVGPTVAPAQAATAGSGSCVQTVSDASGVVVTTPTVNGRGSCQVHFTQGGPITWTIPEGILSFSVLVVGAGGGGGADAGGGGGGGAVFDGTVSLVNSSAAGSMSVSVGAGGLPGVHTSTGVQPFHVTRNPPTSGGNSSIAINDSSAQNLLITANGGSAGGYGSSGTQAQGGVGGSVSVVNSSALVSGSGTPLVGASGGAGVAFDLASSGTSGGNGFSRSSFPSNDTIGGAYGGGGGGGASIGVDADVGGAGGSGGGGSGSGGLVSLQQGVVETIGGRVYSGAPQTGGYARVFASAGVANTGGGGGSGAAHQTVGQYSIDGVSNHSRNGRSGGSGVVVIRYELPLGTLAATSVDEITTTTATVASIVTSSSSVSARGFVFGESTDPTIGAGGVTNVTAGSGTGSFSANLTGLTMGTTYYVRAYATNGGGTAYGATQVFTTAPNTITTTAGSIRWFEGPTVVDAGLSITGADISGASVSIENNKTGDVLACPSTLGTGISCSYNTSSGVLTLSGSATANVYQTVMRGITFSASNVSTNTDNRTILFNLGGSLTFDLASGHYYEIVTVSSGGSVYSTGNPNGTKGDLSSGRNISWEESRCRAKYTNASFSGTLENFNMSGTTRLADRTTQANDGCVVNGGGSLVPRTLNGLPGHLANITSLAEHQFLRTKLTGTGWIGGSDIDLEGTWIWMDGPEAGQVFWIQSATGTRRGVNSISGVDRFNYWSDGEPNNASGEHWAEFGFGSAGVGSSWNDCRNGCGRTTYIVEYSASGGVVPPALSATRIVAPLASQSITFSPSSSLVYGAPAVTLSATSSAGATVSLSVTTGDGTTCSLAGTTLSWVGPGNCVVTATAPGSDTVGGYQPAAPLNRTIEMTRKNLPITGLSAVSREYNRASGVTVTGTAVFNDADLVAGDAGSVSVGGTPTGTVTTSTVGSNKAVTVSGVTLSGARAFAYQTVVSGVTVNITVRPVRLAGSFTVADRDYNGSATVTPSSTSLTLRAGDVIAGDTVNLGATYGADSANAGARVASPQASLSGTHAANYVLDTTGQPTASFTIDPLSLTVASGTFSVQSRAADGSVVATIPSNDLQLQGFLAGESISDITWTPRGVFDSAAAGEDKVVTLESGAVFGGAKGVNYVLDITGAPTSLGTITAAPVAPAQQAQPPVDVTPTPGVPRRGPIIRTPQEPRVQSNPVLREGRPSAPPSAPTSLVNGVPTPVTTQVTDPNSMNIQTGALNFGLNVQNGQGGVRQGAGGAAELDVTKGGKAVVQGSGLQPRSFVQVFLPLQGDNAREIGRLTVDESGSFNGDLVFGSRASENQLPIGRNVLQILSVDEQGRQSVVEMTVNVAQPPPAPEIDRQIQLLPTLDPGASITTRDGFPIPVSLTTSSARDGVMVAGDGWTMSVALGDENSAGETGDGAVLRFTRDKTASVTGTGFMPGTRADIWLFSEPTLLGSVQIGEDGSFSGLVNIDSNVVPVGDHTLQLQGVGTDGYVLATNVGVVVADLPDTNSSVVEQAAGFVWWIVLVLGVTALLVAALIVRQRVSRRRS